MKRIIYSTLTTKDNKFILVATFVDKEKDLLFYRERELPQSLAVKWLLKDKSLCGQALTVKDNL